MRASAIVVGIVSSLLWTSGSALAKRAAPKEVAPVVHEGIRYVAAFAGGAGSVEAWDVKANKKSWEVKVYDVRYDDGMEKDVQDVYIVSMKLEGGKLIVGNEAGKSFAIDIKSRKVEPLKN